MGLVKSIGKNERIRGALCWVAAQYIRLVWLTGRWDVENAHIPAEYWDQGRPFILAFWHGRLLMMMKIWRGGMPISMLISQHRDGKLIARTSAHFGIGSIEGSTSRGGAQALRSILKTLRGGNCIGITPDGPRGPRMHSSAGLINIARLSGCPIIPACYSSTSRRLLKSWDRFAVTFPFSRGVFLWGEPIFVPKDLDEDGVEAMRLKLQDAMIAQAADADRRMGVPPVDPA
ncbi:MAG: lysophospholipid acyltransferase family protein [Magnetospirillum sp.]|nr:lysophospholipid acyltransferase family protein [Magnetospirillum sp.]